MAGKRTKFEVYLTLDPKSEKPELRSKSAAKKHLSSVVKTNVAEAAKPVVRTTTEDY